MGSRRDGARRNIWKKGDGRERYGRAKMERGDILKQEESERNI